jgi:hypothetical protein
MADTRTLKLSLIADVKKFTDGMNRADDDTKTLNDKVGGYSKKMAAAFLGVATAVGIMATKIGIDSIKAASDDELSQNKLRDAILKVKGATDDTVTSTEKWIEKMQFTKGFADSELRPALSDLTRYTGDVNTAQRLLNDAMDIAAAKGLPLETVAKGIGKAYDGQFTALKKLGVPLDEAKTKSGEFEGIMVDLNAQFSGAAASNADTYAGKVNILQQRFGELQESLGQKLIDKFVKVVDMTSQVAKGFSGEDPEGLSNRARELAGQFSGNGAYSLGGSLKLLADSFAKLFSVVTDDGDETTTSLQGLAEALQSIAGGINAIASAYKKARDIGGKIMDFISIDPGEGPKFADSRLGKAIGYQSRAAGGPVMAGGMYRVGEFGPETFVAAGSGSIRPANGSGQGVTIIMNGVIDGESASRSIERLLQDSSRRTGAINLVGATL